MADTPNACSTEDLTNKPGWQTSEFYVTLMTAMLPAITVVFHKDFTGTQVQAWATVAAAFASVGYSLSRAHSKKAMMTAKAEVHAVQCAHQPVEAAPVVAPSSTVPIPIDTVALILARLDEVSDAVKAGKRSRTTV